MSFRKNQRGGGGLEKSRLEEALNGEKLLV